MVPLTPIQWYRLLRYDGTASPILSGYNEGQEIGKEKGRSEGRAEGEIKTKLETAKKMKTMELAPETIIQITGLSAEEIERL